MKADDLPEGSKYFDPPSIWNIFQLKERKTGPEDSKKVLFSENIVLYFRAENVYPLKVTQRLGEYIKYREPK